jgi:hypothetical protein
MWQYFTISTVNYGGKRRKTLAGFWAGKTEGERETTWKT